MAKTIILRPKAIKKPEVVRVKCRYCDKMVPKYNFAHHVHLDHKDYIKDLKIGRSLIGHEQRKLNKQIYQKTYKAQIKKQKEKTKSA